MRYIGGLGVGNVYQSQSKGRSVILGLKSHVKFC